MSWALNNNDYDRLSTALQYLGMCENEKMDFKILDTLESSGVYKLVPLGSIKYMVEKYRKIFYDKDKHKTVPKIILNGPYEIKKWFLKGYYEADGSKTGIYSIEKDRI